MNLDSYLFTSESVSEGHPDKIADQISDCVLDMFLENNPNSRVACEAAVTTNHITLLGEVKGNIDKNEIEDRIRSLIKTIGYDQKGFSYKNVKILNLLHEQSKDIAIGVDETESHDLGAGDQGIMFGYACNETEDFMPAPIYYSHKILQSLSKERHNNKGTFLEPDSKSQVTLEYINNRPVRAKSVVVSTQHKESVTQDELRELVIKHIEKVLPEGWMPEDNEIYINPTGRFVIGGPDGDAGLTGRKIIVDTYGGSAPHGGGAFSGKDYTKVDRSAAYVARYLAKNVVSAGLAKQCTLQLSYAIGISHPLSLYIDTKGTSKIEEQLIAKKLQELVDLTPRGIRTKLKLNNPIYLKTASYGHFGRKPEGKFFTWEKCDLVDDLKKLL